MSGAAFAVLLLLANAPVKPYLPVSLERWEVTLGQVEKVSPGRMRVEAPKLRAVAQGCQDPEAELRFTYLGPSQERSQLASGGERRQLGLKLLAQDGCNLLYVMWRFAPKAEVVVQLKRNPGQHHSAQCGANGYTTVRPKRSKKVQAPEEGSAHRLRARLDGDLLQAWADGQLVWEGRVPKETLDLRGPVGVRADNARFDFEVLTP